MEDRLRALSRTGWLAEQPEPFRLEIARIGRWQSWEAGRLVWQAGDPAEGLYGVGAGAVEQQFPLGDTLMPPTYWAEPGMWFGDSETLAGVPRLGAMVVARDAELFMVPGHALSALLERHPVWWRCLYDLRVRNTARLLTLAAEALALSTSGRVARRLMALAGNAQAVSITQDELAALVGATRSSVSRALAELEQDGLVRRHYGRIDIADREGLSAVGQEEAG
jgi:CRP-like cAMP-binding protein